jgi:hypothetical protein
MTSEIFPADINKKYCCEELQLVIELDNETLSSSDEGPYADFGTFGDLRDLSVCPFCGAALSPVHDRKS